MNVNPIKLYKLIAVLFVDIANLVHFMIVIIKDVYGLVSSLSNLIQWMET